MPKLKLPALALLAGFALSACGFHLRGSGGDTSFAQNLYIEGPGSIGSTFVGSFGTALTGAGGNIVSNPAASTAVLYLYQARYLRQPITLNRTGRATGFDLIYRVSFELRGPQGEVLQPRKEFEAKREYFNDQTLPLAQLSEENQIREELEKEAAQTLLRRVAVTLRRPVETPAAEDPPS
ncbi:MAG: LPS assembly lipoprotein LptE [Candidatus Methylumidiphilus sp.]